MAFPKPAFLIGTVIQGKPNFMLAAFGGIANGDPPMISVSIKRRRYTHQGILSNLAFSVNVPSIDQARETDYCGIVSGRDADKAAICRFHVFYGGVENAPLIEQCPINMECTVAHILDLGTHDLIIGKIEETHISEHCYTDDKLDVHKIRPIVFTRDHRPFYQALGKTIADAYSIGLDLKNATTDSSID